MATLQGMIQQTSGGVPMSGALPTYMYGGTTISGGVLPNAATPTNQGRPDYLVRMKEKCTEKTWELLQEGVSGARPNAIFIPQFSDDPPKRAYGLDETRQLINTQDDGFLVIENIAPGLISAIGNLYEIDLAFFPQHFCRTKSQDPTQRTALQEISEALALRPCPHAWHLQCENGALFKSVRFGKGSNTDTIRPAIHSNDSGNGVRISFHRLKANGNLHLVLIGGGPSALSYLWSNEMESLSAPVRTDVNASSTTNPQITWSYPEILLGYYKHFWNQDMLRGCAIKVAGGSSDKTDIHTVLGGFCWNFSLGMFDSALDLADEQVQTLSLTAVDEPTKPTLTRLNDCRKTLQRLRKKLSSNHAAPEKDAVDWEFSERRGLIQEFRMSSHDAEQNLLERRDGQDKRAAELFASLSDSIQLLIGVISVNDAATNQAMTRYSMKQNEYSMVLTILASFYLPLSIGTGIFGMNIKEVNGSDSKAHWWALVVTVVIIFIVSLVIVAIVIRLPRALWWRRLRRIVMDGEA